MNFIKEILRKNYADFMISLYVHITDGYIENDMVTQLVEYISFIWTYP